MCREVACECECSCLQGPEEDTGSCVAGVTGYCELPNMDAGYLAWSYKIAAKAMLLTVEPSFQHWFYNFYGLNTHVSV